MDSVRNNSSPRVTYLAAAWVTSGAAFSASAPKLGGGEFRGETAGAARAGRAQGITC